MIGILSKDISIFWDSIKNAIIKGNDKSHFLDAYPIDYIEERLKSASWQCWATQSAFIITCVTILPSGAKVFEILLAVGAEMEDWIHDAWATLKAYAKHSGCREMQFRGRKGWTRYAKTFEPDIELDTRYKVKL